MVFRIVMQAVSKQAVQVFEIAMLAMLNKGCSRFNMSKTSTKFIWPAVRLNWGAEGSI